MKPIILSLRRLSNRPRPNTRKGWVGYVKSVIQHASPFTIRVGT